MPSCPSSVVVVVVVNFSFKICISQKLFDNFFSSLAWSFIRNVPMYCKNVDLVESSHCKWRSYQAGRPLVCLPIMVDHRYM